MKWRSKCWFCFVRIDQTYQPWYKRRTVPPCGPFLATSNISPNNKINTNTMVKAAKKNLLQVPGGKYGKLMKHSTRWCQQANKGNSGLEAERVRAYGAFRILWSKQKLAAEKRQESHFLSNKEREKLIDDYVERETTVARKRVQDAETAMMQEQDHMGHVEKGRWTTTKPEVTFEKMLDTIGDSLSDLARSKAEEKGEDEDDDEEDTGHGKLSEDDEPGWMMGTISRIVQHCTESYRQKQMRLDELPQLGWGDAADYFHKRDMNCGTTELRVPAVRKPQTDSTAAAPSL